MKRIVCEVCSGSDFIKDNSVFVCQSCGCKYTLEEARALMQDDGAESPAAVVSPEAAPEASGAAAKTAVVDEQASKIENLRTLARRAKGQNDSQNAANFYQQLLMLEPNDWEANFYTTFYSAHNIKIAEMGSAAIRVSNSFDAVLRLVRQNVLNPVLQKAAALEISLRVISFKEMIISNFTSHMGSNYDMVVKNLDNWVVPAISMMITLGDKLASILDDYEAALKMYQAAANDARKLEKFSNLMKNLRTSAETKQKSAEQTISQRKRAEAIRKRNEYWEAHAEEKAALDRESSQLASEKQSLSDQVRELEKERDNVPAHAEFTDLSNRIKACIQKKSSLGLFSGKEKKALQGEIDELSRKKDAVKKTMDAQQSEVQARIDPLKSQIRQKEQRIDAIKRELEKDR